MGSPKNREIFCDDVGAATCRPIGVESGFIKCKMQNDGLQNICCMGNL